MSHLSERHEQERQMELEMEIRRLRIQRIKHMMARDLNPFDPEFEDAADQLRKLEAEQRTAFLNKLNFHIETCDLERAAEQGKRDAEEARKNAEWRAKHPRLAAQMENSEQ